MKIVVAVSIVMLAAFYAYYKWENYQYEAYLLSSTGLDLDRDDVELIFFSSHSAHFGSDSISIYGFQPVHEVSLLGECDNHGYSKLKDSGVTRIHVLLESALYIKSL